MATVRLVQREWLDELPAADPRAIRSRRDLARVNLWMLQAGIMVRALSRHHLGGPPRAIMDLGGGDGRFMLRVASSLAPRWQDVSVVVLDQQDIISRDTRAAFERLHWQVRVVKGDLFQVLAERQVPSADIVTANLFLHHFQEPQLGELFARIAPLAPLFVACEPRRAAPALLASRMLWAIGCNDVSRHDAVVSVQAGFNGNELSALWADPAAWRLHEHAAGPFSHCFVAQRLPTGASP